MAGVSSVAGGLGDPRAAGSTDCTKRQGGARWQWNPHRREKLKRAFALTHRRSPVRSLAKVVAVTEAHSPRIFSLQRT